MYTKEELHKIQAKSKEKFAEIKQAVKDYRHEAHVQKFQQFMNKHQQARQIPTDISSDDLIVTKDMVLDGTIQEILPLKYRNIFIAEGAKLFLKDLALEADSIKVHGELIQENIKINSNSFFASHISHIKSNKAELFTKSAEFYGQMLEGNNKYLAEQQITANKIVFGARSEVNLNTLVINASEIENRGKINIKNDLKVLADYFDNEGSIEASSASYQINRWLFNKGYLDAANATIDAVALLNFWRIRGTNDLTINALSSFNFGWTQSFNLTGYQLIKFNLAHIPDLPNSWSDVFNKQSLLNGIKVAGSIAFPAVATGINVCSSVISTYKALSGLYAQIGKIYIKYKSNNLSASEALPVLTSMFNTASAAWEGGIKHISMPKMPNSFNDFVKKTRLNEALNTVTSKSELKNFANKVIQKSGITENPLTNIQGQGFKNIAKTAITTLGPKVNNNSLVNVNGIQIATSISESNIVGTNLGLEAGMSLVSHSALSMQNEGAMLASDVVMTGRFIDNEGLIYANNNLHIHAQAFEAQQNSRIAIGNIGIIEAEKTLRLDENCQIQAKEATVIIKNSQPEIKTRGEIKTLVVEGAHIDDVNGLLVGTRDYKHLNVTQSLAVKVDDSFELNETLQRNCAIDVTATNAQINIPVDTSFDLHVTTTQGDISLNKEVNSSKQVCLNAAGNVNIGNESMPGISINGQEGIDIIAKGDVNNHGKLSSQKLVRIEANNLTNQCHGKDTGIIEGNKIYIKTEGDVNNLCHVEKYTAGHFRKGGELVAQERTQFHSAVIQQIGNCDDNEPSVIIDAGGEINLDASKITAESKDILISGKKNINIKLRAEKYTSELHYDHKGKKLKKYAEGLDAQTSCIEAKEGRNQILSEEGAINGQAENIVSKYGSDIVTKQEGQSISLKDYHDQLSYYQKKKKLLKTTKKQGANDVSIPGLIANTGKGETHIHAAGDLNIEGHKIDAKGKLELAAKNIHIKQRVLDNWQKTKTTHLGVQVFGQNIGPGSGQKNKTERSDSPLVTKLDNLAHSQNLVEGGLNTVSAGMEVAKTLNAVSQVESVAGLVNTAADHYGLSPSLSNINVQITQTTQEEHYQTLSDNYIKTDELNIKAENKVTLGVPTHVSGNATVKAKCFEQQGQILQHSLISTRKNITVSPKVGDIPVDVALAENKQKMTSTTVVNQQLNVSGVLRIESDQWILNNAVTNTNKIEAKVGEVTLNSSVSTCETRANGWQASTTGNVGVQTGKSCQQTIIQPSAINVKGDVTDDNFQVDQVNLNAGKITSEGKIDLQKPKINVQSIDTQSYSKSQGFSTNLNQIAKMTQPEGADAFSTAKVSDISSKHIERQEAVIFGAQGTNINSENVSGNLHTTSSNGNHVLCDKKQRLVTEIPLNISETIKQTQSALNELNSKLSDFKERKEEVPNRAASSAFKEKDNTENRYNNNLSNSVKNVVSAVKKSVGISSEAKSKQKDVDTNKHTSNNNHSGFFTQKSQYQIPVFIEGKREYKKEKSVSSTKGPRDTKRLRDNINGQFVKNLSSAKTKSLKDEEFKSTPKFIRPYASIFSAETDNARIDISAGSGHASAEIYQKEVIPNVTLKLGKVVAETKIQDMAVSTKLSADLISIEVKQDLLKVCHTDTSYTIVVNEKAGIGAGLEFTAGYINHKNGKSSLALGGGFGVGPKIRVQGNVEIESNDPECDPNEKLHFPRK